MEAKINIKVSQKLVEAVRTRLRDKYGLEGTDAEVDKKVELVVGMWLGGY